MPTLWFSYSFAPDMTLDSPEPNRNPYAITWHVGRALRTLAQEHGYEFQYVNLDDAGDYAIGPDDIVIGHPWYAPDEVAFIEQAFDADCKARIIMQPYAIVMVGDEALDRLHRLWTIADKLLLITGPYWHDTMGDTPYASYLHKVVRLDNASSAALHPYSKRRWGKPGKRAVLAIGHGAPSKGMDRLAELARVAGFKLGHYGSVEDEVFQHVATLKRDSGRIFDQATIQELCDEYDFFFTMGRWDANPTTLTETALWGLIGACTKESGYWPDKPFVELRADDMAFNLEQVERLQYMSEYDLRQRSQQMRAVMEQHFTWQRMIDGVCEVVGVWL